MHFNSPAVCFLFNCRLKSLGIFYVLLTQRKTNSWMLCFVCRKVKRGFSVTFFDIATGGATIRNVQLLHIVALMLVYETSQ